VLFFFVSYHLRFVFSARSFAIKDRGIVLPHLISGQFIEHWKPSILQRIQPSSMLHFSRDIRVHSLRILLGGPRLSSAPMGFE
jgi:hypothetical protein